MNADRAHTLLIMRRADETRARRALIDAEARIVEAGRDVERLHDRWWEATTRARDAEQRLGLERAPRAGKRALLESLMVTCRADAANAARVLLAAQEKQELARASCEGVRDGFAQAVRARLAADEETRRVHRRSLRQKERREQAATDDLAQGRHRR